MASEKVLKEFMKEVKKALLDEKPIATVMTKGLHFYSYTAECSAGCIYFKIPISVVEARKLSDKVKAHSIIKYIL